MTYKETYNVAYECSYYGCSINNIHDWMIVLIMLVFLPSNWLHPFAWMRGSYAGGKTP